MQVKATLIDIDGNPVLMNQEFSDDSPFGIILYYKNYEPGEHNNTQIGNIAPTIETVTLGQGDRIRNGTFVYLNLTTIRFPCL